MDKKRRTSILKQTDNEMTDSAKKVVNTRRVSFSRQKVVKEYYPSGVGIPEASFQQDMNLTPSTEGNNTAAVMNLTGPASQRSQYGAGNTTVAVLNLTEEDVPENIPPLAQPNISSEGNETMDCTLNLFGHRPVKIAEPTRTTTITEVLHEIEDPPSKADGAQKLNLTPSTEENNTAAVMNLAGPASQRSQYGAGNTTAAVLNLTKGVPENIPPLAKPNISSEGNETMGCTLNLFDHHPIKMTQTTRSITITEVRREIENLPRKTDDDQKVSPTPSMGNNTAAVMNLTGPASQRSQYGAGDTTVAVLNLTEEDVPENIPPLAQPNISSEGNETMDCTLNLFGHRPVKIAEPTRTTTITEVLHEDEIENPPRKIDDGEKGAVPVACRIRRSLDLNRSYPNIDLLMNLSKDNVNVMDVTPGFGGVKASDTLLLSVNRNAREPTFPESMLLENTAFDSSIKSPTTFDADESIAVSTTEGDDEPMEESNDEVTEEKMEESFTQPSRRDTTGNTFAFSQIQTPDTPINNITEDTATAGFSQIETPDTLIHMDGSTFVANDSNTANQIRGYKSKMSETLNANGNTYDVISKECRTPVPVQVYDPVNVDVDPAWVEVACEAVKPLNSDHGDVKDLKRSARQRLLNTLKEDVRALSEDYQARVQSLREENGELAEAFECLDVSALGKALYDVCEHERFYVQHEWFNMVAYVNKSHLEQIQDAVKNVEDQSKIVKQQQLLISKLPEMNERYSELTARSELYKWLEEQNVEQVAAEIVEAAGQRRRLRAARKELVDLKVQLWEDWFEAVKRDDEHYNQEVAEISQMIEGYKKENASMIAELTNVLASAEIQGYVADNGDEQSSSAGMDED